MKIRGNRRLLRYGKGISKEFLNKCEIFIQDNISKKVYHFLELSKK